MPIEAERRQSGVWTVLFQPDLPGGIIRTYQKELDYLGLMFITHSRFERMREYQKACVDVTATFASPINKILHHDDFTMDNEAALLLSDDVGCPFGVAQSGQSVLRMRQIHSQSPICIIDPSCYILGIPYDKMPIAVGDLDFIERSMSELYSLAINSILSVKLSTSKPSL